VKPTRHQSATISSTRDAIRRIAAPRHHNNPPRAQNPYVRLCAGALSRKREILGDFRRFSSPVPTTTYNPKPTHPFKSVRAHHVHRPCIRRARATDHRLCDGRCEQPTAHVSQIETRKEKGTAHATDRLRPRPHHPNHRRQRRSPKSRLRPLPPLGRSARLVPSTPHRASTAHGGPPVPGSRNPTTSTHTTHALTPSHFVTPSLRHSVTSSPRHSLRQPASDQSPAMP